MEHALNYAARGFHVVPLHTPDPNGRCSCHKAACSSVGKHPRTLAGLKEATTDQAQITNWWSMWPAANVGLVTGAISGFFVLDIDPGHGGVESLKSLLARYLRFEDSVWAKTGGGGWHLLFKHPGFRVGNVQGTPDRPGKLGPGLDVRGDGGFIVAPPSRHQSGQVYRWGTQYEVIAPAPAWLLSLLTAPTAGSIHTDKNAAAGEIGAGRRNQTLTSFAGSMRRRGMSGVAIAAALAVENQSRCAPPLPEAEVQKIVQSVARYSPQDPASIYPEQTTLEGDRPDGIIFASELFARIDALYKTGMPGGFSTGWTSFDTYYTVKLGQWTVVTGQPSSGKSAVLDALLVNLVRLHKWKFCITSFENQPLERHAAMLMALWAGKSFGEGIVPRMSPEEKEAAKQWLNDYFVFVLPTEDGATVAGILERAAWVIKEQNIQGVLIDPWNELEHRRYPSLTETEYISQSLTRMRRFVRDRNVHLWLVAHPTKLQKDVKTGSYPVPTLYDISGSAHFRNKCDFGLSIWRDLSNEKSPTEIHVQKVRFRECGRPGKCDLYFDVVTGRYGEMMPNTYADYDWMK